MMDLFRQYEIFFLYLTGFSVLCFVGSLVLIPWLVVRIPHDYFASGKRRPVAWANRHPALRGLLRFCRNLLGIFFLLVGVLLLFIPGQGVLTMVVGVLMMDFSGKFNLEKKLIHRPAILRSLNWVRKKAGHRPLELDHQDTEGPADG